VAVDAALSGDCFGILAIGATEDEDKYRVAFSRKWTPPPGKKLNFKNDEGTAPENVLRWLINEYDVIEVCYDPYQLEDMMQSLRSEGNVFTHAFTQNTQRNIADKELYDMIKGRKIYHNGDPDLREHIRNANQKVTGDERSMRIVKRSDDLKIDLAICLSMACKRAKTWRL
jgi:phage terminase large subunit-like protein